MKILFLTFLIETFEYMDYHYEYILRPFENMLQTGEKIDTFTKEKSTINIPNEDCFICRIDNVNVETTCCYHYYCYRCLNMWFHRENPSCPNCRTVLEKCFVKTL